MTTALVCCYGGGHARSLLPLIRDLRKRGQDVKVLALTAAYSYFLDEDVEAFSLSDVLVRATDWEEIKKYAEKSSVYGGLDHLSNSERDTVAYMGSGFRDLCRTHGETSAAGLFAEKGRKAFDQSHTAIEVLNYFEPDLLISTNAPRFERAIIYQAGIAKIKSLVVVDGPAKREMTWLSDESFGDHLAVFHESVKNNLVRLGRSSESITVTGNPAFDSLREFVLRRHDSSLRAMPHVVYLSQQEALLDVGFYDIEKEKSIVKSVTEALFQGQVDGLLTTEVRFHPHQKDDVRVLNSRLVDCSLTSTIEDTLQRADVVVTASSTAGLQAQFMGIPVVEIGWSILSGLAHFEDVGEVVKANQANQLIDAILEASKRPSSPSDSVGLATDHLSKIVEGML